MNFDPTSVEVLCVTLPKDHCVQVPWKYIKVCGYSDLFCKNLKQRSLTPRWPLTPHLLRSHVWLYPRIIVSKSHENTSKYVDTVTLFAKTWTKGQWPLDDLWPRSICKSQPLCVETFPKCSTEGVQISNQITQQTSFYTHVVHQTIQNLHEFCIKTKY